METVSLAHYMSRSFCCTW